MNNIGWIGTGVMGASMCQHILEKDPETEVYVYNRTKSKAEPLIEHGAIWCDSVAEVAQNSSTIFTIVGYPKDVKQVVLGEDGVLKHTKSGTTLVEMTTSKPALAEKISKIALEKGIQTLDAPVSGGDTGAKEGTLAIMVGGDEEAFRDIKPVLELFGKNIAYMGGAGKGQHTKMSNQILIASTMIGVVESLLYAAKAGMDMNEVIEVIGKGAASSWSINNLGTRIAEADFDPGFFIKHFVKDMRIALDEARRMNLSMPGLALAEQFYTAAMAMGHENLGTQGLYKVFERINNSE